VASINYKIQEQQFHAVFKCMHVAYYTSTTVVYQSLCSTFKLMQLSNALHIYIASYNVLVVK